MNTSILKYFTGQVYTALAAVEEDVREIRLRAGSPLAVLTEGGIKLLDKSGSCAHPQDALTIFPEDIRRTFEAICKYSVHSFQSNINSGFLTVDGGHRAGICGTAVYSRDGIIENVRSVSSICFRIAHEVIGCADRIFTQTMNMQPCGVLIAGPPCSGKTTVLRDLCRQLGDRFAVSLIDERNEIAAVASGAAQNDVGMFTDVFSGYSKPDGIISAVRSMSPEVIICDEIGSDADLNAIYTASLSGIRTVAAIHASDSFDLSCRSNVMETVKNGAFRYIVFMENRQIKRIITAALLLEKRRLRDEVFRNNPAAIDVGGNGLHCLKQSETESSAAQADKDND